MAEYMDRDAALIEIERREALMVGDKRVSVDEMKSFIKNRPAADVAPVVHGRWIYEAETLFTLSGYCCSVCRRPRWLSPDVPEAFKYCPNCGAKMQEVE